MRPKEQLRQILIQALQQAQASGEIAFETLPAFEVEEPKQADHGDLATNLAMVLAKPAKMAPRKIAEIITNNLAAPEGMLQKVEIAGPGFINFFIAAAYWRQVIPEIYSLGLEYGNSELGRGQKVQVEFVSANPTGPLHIGHGRGAALGDALANLLTAAGYEVVREYYINDVGNQINTLGKSLYFRLRELQGEKIDFPEDGYQGDYMKDLARDYLAAGNPPPSPSPTEEDFVTLGRYAGDVILAGIKKDLEDFGVSFDRWFSETDLYDQGEVEKSFQHLKEKGFLYEQDGALWFKSTAFGDDKDRVVRRSTGVTTYFASDIAYHLYKFQQDYNLVVDIWGADHHGYVPRLQAAVEALGVEGRLQVILVQLVSLLRHGEPVAMTTRGGTFVTLREVIDEVGKDAARFIFLTRRPDSHLDFDLEVAKTQSPENPVYYVQYAHARLASVFRQAEAQEIPLPEPDPGLFPLLQLPEETSLLKMLAHYPELMEAAARNLEPHRITYFLTDLASQLHSYYYKHRFISEDAALTQARLCLVQAIQTVLAHGLGILGVEAPETM
ncbi:MAG: arginine--tRNA ligase [Syntrophales bacterium]|nr:arginine--tRNA ligase [Syntrophales bacterium]MDD5642294.1 arginine--tRNA ligase [Syntrophales bacterium]